VARQPGPVEGRRQPRSPAERREGPVIEVPNGPRDVGPMASPKGPFGNGPRTWSGTTVDPDEIKSITEERDTTMTGRLRILGVVLAVFGLAFLAGGGYTFYRTQEGARSLQAFSAAQQIKLSYNDQGQLVDRGKTEEAQGILSLLENDWGYPVVASDLNPNDPTVNTASEYMYQMATIAYHTLHGTQTVTLTEPKEYNGKTYPAGEYQVPVDGRYFSQFDRMDPLQGPARDQAWSGTAHALIAELGVGTMTATSLQMGYGLAGLFAGIGLTVLVAGLGLVWAARPVEEKAPKTRAIPQPIPA
jgi:hypothetical protein